MEDSRERIAHELSTRAVPGWPVTITYRNGTSKNDTMTLTAPFVGVGTDLRKLRGERRYAIVDAARLELGLIVIPFGIITHVDPTGAPAPKRGATDA